MHSKRYESTEVDRRIWLHVPPQCPLELSGPPASTPTKTLKYIKSLLVRCTHYFKSKYINNIDYKYAHCGYWTLISEWLLEV